MKKNIIITIISVLVIVAVCAVSFAAWDIKTANLEFNVFNGASNVVLTVDSKNYSTNTKLVPSGVNIGAGEATQALVGEFKLVLTSDNASTTLDDLKAKVNISASSIDVSSAVEGFDSAWLKVSILKVDADGTIQISGSDTKYSEVALNSLLDAGNTANPGTTYYVAIKFVDNFASNASAAKMANGKQINTVVNFNCVGKN